MPTILTKKQREEEERKRKLLKLPSLKPTPAINIRESRAVIKDPSALSLKDRQELADLRARQAGAPQRLLEPVAAAGIQSRRAVAERAMGPEEVFDPIAEQKLRELAGRVGQETPIGELTPTELAGTEQTSLTAWKGAADAALGRGLQFAGTTAAATIVGGALSLPLAAGGFGVGVVFGAVEGYIDARSASIKSQAQGYEGEKGAIFRASKTTMTRALANAWSGRGEKEDAEVVFTKNWNDGLRAYDQLQLDTQQDIQLRRGVDGTVTLARYKEFYKEGGQGQLFKDEMELAILSAPNIERSIFWTTQADINELQGEA